MPTAIKITAGGESLTAELNDSPTAQAIVAALPLIALPAAGATNIISRSMFIPTATKRPNGMFFRSENLVSGKPAMRSAFSSVPHQSLKEQNHEWPILESRLDVSAMTFYR